MAGPSQAIPRANERAARLYALVARDARRAVVFRRGPTRQTLLLSWNLEDDTLEPGQWFKGRIYERRCDLSPSGRLLVYFAAKYSGPWRSWTAISRPPYLTALALWPKGDGWGGGGLFVNERRLLLNHRRPGAECEKLGGETVLASGFGLPEGFQVDLLGEHPGWGEDDPIMTERLERGGWIMTFPGVWSEQPASAGIWHRCDPPWQVQKPIADSGGRSLRISLHGIHEAKGRWYVETTQIIESGGATLVDLGRTDWADLDHNGDVLFAADGRLYRMRAKRHRSAQVGRPKLVADLNPMTFRGVEAPGWAIGWP